MVTPKLSIIIVTWNTAQITLRCLKSIHHHLGNFPYEIIVVDNGSTDGTASELKHLRYLHLLENSTNLGFSQASNQGAAAATGDYLLFLNSDMEITDDSIISMYNYINSHSQIGIIGPKFLNPDLTPQGSVLPPQTIPNAFREFWLDHPSFSKYIPATNQPLSVWSISGGAILVSRELFATLGGFDPKYFMYFEDLDLCRKVRNRGLLVYFYPQCTVIHRHGTSGRHLADHLNQWRRLIPSSIKYHGFIYHQFLTFTIWSGQKWQRIFHR